MELEMAPKTNRAQGEVGREPFVYPDVHRDQAQRMATIAMALAAPIRIQLVEVLRKHAGDVCVCELVPLVDVAQPTLPSRPGTRRAGSSALVTTQPRASKSAITSPRWPATCYRKCSAAGVTRPEEAPRGQATR